MVRTRRIRFECVGIWLVDGSCKMEIHVFLNTLSRSLKSKVSNLFHWQTSSSFGSHLFVKLMTESIPDYKETFVGVHFAEDTE